VALRQLNPMIASDNKIVLVFMVIGSLLVDHSRGTQHHTAAGFWRIAIQARAFDGDALPYPGLNNRLFQDYGIPGFLSTDCFERVVQLLRWTQ
jgi:hypothetical protein